MDEVLASSSQSAGEVGASSSSLNRFKMIRVKLDGLVSILESLLVSLELDVALSSVRVGNCF